MKTGRQGAAAKAGHNLVISVTSWEGTLDVGEDADQSSLELDADARSLRVQEGHGGAQALADDDKADIQQTIDDEVLKGDAIEFRSTSVEPSDDGGRLRVGGDLKMAGNSHPVEFDLSVSPKGKIEGGPTIKQTDWGIKPYSALFGALKVTDEVEIVIEASLPSD
ncbi:MAG: YceI family protein [Actinomycetota bacterium]|nr:YceI family protein [Actinomycetota bacterium]